MLVRFFAPLRLIGGLLVTFLALGCISTHAQSQTKPPLADKQEPPLLVDHEPVYITVRIFQARAKKGTYQDLNDQVFKFDTSFLTSYEKWVTGLKKAYPEFKIELLKTTPMRILKSPRPGTVIFGDPKGRRFEFNVYAANGAIAGTKPGTSLIFEAEFFSGISQLDKPISLAIHPVEAAEEGMTYFFTKQQLGLEAKDYVTFIRPDASPKAFEDEHFYLIFTASVSFKKPAETARSLNDKQSADLQASATKKVEPTLPEAVSQMGLKGSVQVTVEIGPDGRVTSADVVKSSLPEANDVALAAARKWEFPVSVFAESKQPVKGTLNFNFTPPPSTSK